MISTVIDGEELGASMKIDLKFDLDTNNINVHIEENGKCCVKTMHFAKEKRVILLSIVHVIQQLKEQIDAKPKCSSF